MNGSRGGLVLAGVLCGYGLLVVTYLESQEIRVSHDDAYINYVYARNLVGGDGLSFHPDERVWGYTSPAQVLLLTGLAGLGADLPRATPIAGFAFAGLCGLLSFGLIRRVIDAPLPAALGAFWLTTWSPLLALNVTLEGNFLIATQLGFLGLLGHRHTRAAALVGSLSCLVRPDSVVLVVPALLLDRDTRRLLPLALFALPGLLWIGFAFGYYGTIVPSTLFAKSGMSSFLDYVPRSAYFAFGTGFPANLGEAAVTAGGVALTLAKLSLAGLAIRRIGRSAPPLLYPIGVYPFVLVVAYGIIGAPAHYWEIQSASFFFHVAVVVGLLDLIQRIAHSVPASAHSVPASARRVASIATIALALFWIGANVRGTLEMLQGQQSWLWRGAKYELYRDVAEWANRELPRGTRIATSEVGVLGYFAEKFRIVDDAGLVSQVFGPGGDLGDAHYFRSQRPEYLLLLGDPRGRRVRGRAITPVHSFPFEASDFGLGLATLARIEPEPAP